MDEIEYVDSPVKCDDCDCDCETEVETKRKTKAWPPCCEIVSLRFAHFLLGFASLGTFRIYMNPFLLSVGLTAARAGIITGLTFIPALLTGPLWRVITHCSGHGRLIFSIICISSAVSIGTLPIIARALRQTVHNHTCDSPNCNAHKPDSNEDYFGAHSFDSAGNSFFFGLLFISTIGGMFFNNLPSFFETVTSKCFKCVSSTMVIRKRQLTELGRFAGILVCGYLTDKFNVPGLSVYSIPFFAYVPISLILLPFAWHMIQQYEDKTPSGPLVYPEFTFLDDIDEVAVSLKSRKGRGRGRKLRKTLRQADNIVFLITALIAGLAFNLFIFFSLLLLKESQSISKLQSAFIVGGMGIVNMVVFPFSTQLIRMLGGDVNAIIIGTFAHCIRHIAMAFTNTFWIMLVVQLLHGLSFALLWSAMMSHAKQISSRDIQKRVSRIVYSMHFIISPCLMNVVGGVIYEQYGGMRLFLTNGILCGIWGCVILIYRVISCCKSKSDDEVDDVGLQISMTREVREYSK